MRICFFGHRDSYITQEARVGLFRTITELTDRDDCDFYFGGYGSFDDLAYRCVKEITSPNKIKTIFVTPYITEHYQKNILESLKYKYDMIVYPEIEKTPYRYAISARNKWIIYNSDLVICYINHPFGGAFSAVRQAIGIGKTIINFGTAEIKKDG